MKRTLTLFQRAFEFARQAAGRADFRLIRRLSSLRLALTALLLAPLAALRAADAPALPTARPHIHHPFTPGARFKGASEAERYGDFIQEFDWMVGEVMRTLDELKLRDSTLVILTSDNGGMLNQGGQAAWTAGHRLNGSLLGFKFDAWEGGHRVPFIARWPRKIEAGSVSDQLICQLDLLATFAALTGSEASGPDSVNVLAALIGRPEKPLRDQLVLAPYNQANLALRDGQWIYFGARGGAGFTGTNVGSHSLGGPTALKFTGETNSDVADGKFKPDAPNEQLYDLSPATPRRLATSSVNTLKSPHA